MIRRILLAATLASLTCLLAPPASTAELPVRRYAETAGLGRYPITGIAQDGWGRMWFATHGGGAVMHDGLRPERFDTSNGLPSNVVLAVLPGRGGEVALLTAEERERDGALVFINDREVTAVHKSLHGVPFTGVRVGDDELWLATRTGELLHFADNRLRRPSGLGDRVVSRLALAPDGRLWGIARAAGPDPDGPALVFRTSDQGFRRYAGPAGLPSRGLRDIVVDDDGSPWVATSRGIFRLKGGLFQTPPLTGASLAEPAFSIHGVSAGRIWIGLDNAAILATGDRAVRYKVPAEVDAGPVFDVVESADGAVWLATPSLVLRLSGRRAETLRLSPVRTAIEGGDQVFDIEVDLDEARAANGMLWHDMEGAVWLADGSVALRDEVSRVQGFGLDDGLPSLSVRGLTLDKSQTLWVATDAGVASLDEDWGHFDAVPDFAEPVLTIHATKKAGIFAATAAGIRRIDQETAELWGPGEKAIAISAFATAPDGRLWLSTASGIERFTPDGLVAVSPKEGAAAGPALALVSAGERLYAGHRGGLSVIEEDVVTRLEAFDGQTVQALASQGDKLVLAIVDGRIVRLPDNEPVEEPGPGESFRELFVGSDGAVWIAGESGVYKLRDGARRRMDELVPAGARVNCFGEDRHGNLWVGTDRGLFRHRPARRAPAARVAAAWVGGGWRTRPESITIDAGEDLLLVIEGTSFSHPSGSLALSYQTRIAGVSDEWVPAYMGGLAGHAALPGGSHRLEARVLSSDLAPAEPAIVELVVLGGEEPEPAAEGDTATSETVDSKKDPRVEQAHESGPVEIDEGL